MPPLRRSRGPSRGSGAEQPWAAEPPPPHSAPRPALPLGPCCRAGPLVPGGAGGPRCDHGQQVQVSAVCAGPSRAPWADRRRAGPVAAPLRRAGTARGGARQEGDSTRRERARGRARPPRPLSDSGKGGREAAGTEPGRGGERWRPRPGPRRRGGGGEGGEGGGGEGGGGRSPAGRSPASRRLPAPGSPVRRGRGAGRAVPGEGGPCGAGSAVPRPSRAARSAPARRGPSLLQASL